MSYVQPTLPEIRAAVAASACLRKFYLTLENIVAQTTLTDSPPVVEVIELWRERKPGWFYS